MRTIAPYALGSMLISAGAGSIYRVAGDLLCHTARLAFLAGRHFGIHYRVLVNLIKDALEVTGSALFHHKTVTSNNITIKR